MFKRIKSPSVRIKLIRNLWILACFAVLPSGLAWADIKSARSDPVGFFSLEFSANSDGLLSSAFHRGPAYVGKVLSIINSNTITLDRGNFTEAQFADTHYALFVDGDREGLWAPIVANRKNRLELTFVNEDLGDTEGDRVMAGDSVSIIPFWTPATLLPESVASEATELLVFSRNMPGTNLSAAAVYRYVSGKGWYHEVEVANNLPIYPDESVVLRNKEDAPLSLTQFGKVPLSAFRTVLAPVMENVDQDLRLTTGLPVSVALRDLIDPGSDGVGDQILIFDHEQGGVNREAKVTATYVEGEGWKDGDTDVNDHIFERGRGFIYRKTSANKNDLLIQYKPAYQD